ncbi:hypothetical protein BDZ97DRAFT_1869323 [Flammula alnicola]|nr:hypothetical protein BDZ97DRAFT_1869323 [Flammula alnicola]
MSEMQIRRWVMLLVVGQDQAGRYDILKGTNGESSSPPPLNVTPIPSLCTCNKVYFNIWSACSYATGNNTLPVYAQWTGTCTSNSINLAESASLPSFSRGLGIDIPVWGSMDVPGNTSFDIQQAVVRAFFVFLFMNNTLTCYPSSPPYHHTLTLFSLYIYRRKLANLEWRDEVVHLFHHVPKVKSVDLPTVDDDWQIEQPVSNFFLRQDQNPLR